MEKDDQWPLTGERGLQPLHPAQVHVLRIHAFFILGFYLAAILFLDLGPGRMTDVPAGLVTGLFAFVALLIWWFLPPRRYRAWGYREDPDELHIASGLLFRNHAVMPFARVQHIDIAQGPVERRFGLARLVLHTAGTRAASITLPGLEQAQAEAMRDRIRAKIRQDLY